MVAPELSDDCLLELIKAEVKESHPDQLGLFEDESKALIQSTKDRIERVLAFDQNADVGNLIRASVKSWLKERGADLAYKEYCELMEQQGVKPDSLEKFHRPNCGGADTYRFFVRLRNDGITIGTKLVKEDGPVLIVHTITHICRVNLANKHGQIVVGNIINLDGYRKVT